MPTKDRYKANPTAHKTASSEWYYNNKERVSAAGKARYHANKEIKKLAAHASRQSTIGQAKSLLKGAMGRAKKKEIECDLTAEWINRRLVAGCCEVTGIAFQQTKYGEIRNPFAATIDRVDNRKGYTQDNCKLVVWCYNAAKGCGEHEDVLKLARALCQN